MSNDHELSDCQIALDVNIFFTNLPNEYCITKRKKKG